MFDRMIETDSIGNEVKSRRNYFMVSGLVVGILFLTGVVFSIFAGDFDLGNDEFELQSMLAPVEMSAEAPQPERPQVQRSTASPSTLPTRTINMSRPDEPTIVPVGVSTTRNTEAARPNSPFNIGKVDSDPGTTGTIDRRGTVSTTTPVFNEPEPNTGRDPEPDIKVPPPIKKVTVSKGVVNGLAVSLPKPTYSAAARAVRASGKVDVQILIDESGRVVSASAVSGHPLLKVEAERAARSARFTPTLLTGVAVKVTGVIVYNFVADR